eukprot:TRINITY_DN21482_c0_g1_i1.p1 TRINITY_DN21482_c0_g1~~TRINITY_DN21482_c0_g1_i1.p1  ORF type:complete len:725 (-),score=183.40 TRINITY_DN21482_c0_g1_i1:28-2079(-)
MADDCTPLSPQGSSQRAVVPAFAAPSFRDVACSIDKQRRNHIQRARRLQRQLSEADAAVRRSESEPCVRALGVLASAAAAVRRSGGSVASSAGAPTIGAAPAGFELKAPLEPDTGHGAVAADGAAATRAHALDDFDNESHQMARAALAGNLTMLPSSGSLPPIADASGRGAKGAAELSGTVGGGRSMRRARLAPAVEFEEELRSAGGGGSSSSSSCDVGRSESKELPPPRERARRASWSGSLTHSGASEVAAARLRRASVSWTAQEDAVERGDRRKASVTWDPSSDGAGFGGGGGRRASMAQSASDMPGKSGSFAALCRALQLKFGSREKIFKALAGEAEGAVLIMETLRIGLERSGVPWVKLSGTSDAGKIFEVLDVSDTGVVSFEEFSKVLSDTMRRSTDEEWQFLNTMEKWMTWYDKTERAGTKQLATPTWQANEEVSAMKHTMQEKKSRDREKMKRMIDQGAHKTRDGLRICAKHLLKDFNDDTVQNYRREVLEVVDRKSRRIKQMLTQCTQNRHELANMRVAMHEVQETAKRNEFMDLMKQRRLAMKGKEEAPKTNVALTMDAVNMFSEADLSTEERIIRDLARQLCIPIPDVEAVQVQYKRFCKNGADVGREEFPKMMRALCSDRPEVHDVRKLNELWRDLDVNGDGRISFDEFLVWYSDTCGAPRLCLPGATPGAA